MHSLHCPGPFPVQPAQVGSHSRNKRDCDSSRPASGGSRGLNPRAREQVPASVARGLTGRSAHPTCLPAKDGRGIYAAMCLELRPKGRECGDLGGQLSPHTLELGTLSTRTGSQGRAGPVGQEGLVLSRQGQAASRWHGRRPRGPKAMALTEQFGQ